MGRYYYHHHRRNHYRSELFAPVAIAAIFFVAVLVAFISWVIPNESSVPFAPGLATQTQKPSKFQKFVRGMVRAVKDTVEDDQN